MDIQLANISYSLAQSYQTRAFSADVLIDGENVGRAHNSGLGDKTEIRTPTVAESRIVLKAQDYCKSLPPIIIPPSDDHPYPIEEPMTLYKMIDDMVEKHIQQREPILHARTLQRKMDRNLLLQKPGEMKVKTLIFSEPVNALIESKPAFFQKVVTKQVIPRLGQGYVVINNNIDPAKLQTFGLKATDIVPMPVVDLSRKRIPLSPDQKKPKQRPKK